MQRSTQTFTLSAEMQTHVQWCENRNNMPDFGGRNKEPDQDLLCAHSKNLPRIPVEIFGVIYDLDAISSKRDSATRVLQLQTEVSSKLPITSPQNQIYPVSDAIRDNISSLRKEFAKLTPSVVNNNSLFAAKPAADNMPVSAPYVDERKLTLEQFTAAVKANRQNEAESLRIKHDIHLDVAAEITGKSNNKSYAEYLMMKGAKPQYVLNGAGCAGNVSYVESLLLNHPGLDFSYMLLLGAQDKVFNDDKSLLKFLSGIQNPQLKVALVKAMRTIVPMTCQLDFGLTLSRDFADRLDSLYWHMENYGMNFDSAYNKMAAEFDSKDAKPVMRM